MKKILTFAAIFMLAGCTEPTSCSSDIQPVAFAQVANGPGEYVVVVESVYDGDTFRINLQGLPAELNPVKVRVRGVDSPERGAPRCPAERQGAERARAFAEATLGNRVVISDLEWDKYGGRIDADVLVGPDRRSFAMLLIQSGNARPYTGGQRQGWC